MKASNQPTSKKKMRKSTKWALGIGSSLILLTGGYLGGGYHLVDNALASQIRTETQHLIQNKYIKSVKANVTAKDVNRIRNQIFLIYNPNLRIHLFNETNDVLTQAMLQQRVQSQINAEYYKDSVINLHPDDVKNELQAAQNIRNNDVKVEVIRRGNIVLDRATKTYAATNVVNPLYQKKDLNKSDLGKYYTGEALTKDAYGVGTRKQLNHKLTVVKGRLNRALNAAAETEENQLNAQLNKIHNSSFTGGTTNLSVNQLNKQDMTAFVISNGNDNKDVVLLVDNKLVVYSMNSDHNNVKQVATDNIQQKNLSLPDNVTLNNAQLVYNAAPQNNNSSNNNAANNNSGNNDNNNHQTTPQHHNNGGGRHFVIRPNNNHQQNNRPQNNQQNNNHNNNNHPAQNNNQQPAPQNQPQPSNNNQGTTDNNTANADLIAWADPIINGSQFDSNAPLGNAIRFTDNNGHTVYITTNSNCGDNCIVISSNDFNTLSDLVNNGLIFSNNSTK